MQKNLKKLGKNISETAEVQDVTLFGIWLLIGDHEYFLSYKEYPWFRNATIDQICNIEFSHGKQLYWPDLDIDLSIDVLEHPEAYPLMYTP